MMIELRYPAATPKLEDWRDELKRLVLAHRLIRDEQLATPVLLHSGNKYTGPDAITAYLRQLDEESDQWWYCVCDRK